MFDWFFKGLSWLGFFKKKANIVFLGLDSAGKSTLLSVLKYGTVSAVAPTQQPTSQELKRGSIKFKIVDMGGHDAVVPLWKQYCLTSDGIVFIIDSSDRTRFPAARERLHTILNMPEIENIPILILANKVDLPSAASPPQINYELQLDTYFQRNQKRPIKIFPCSVTHMVGYDEGFKWLAKHL